MRGRPNLYTSYASESRLFPTRTQQLAIGIGFILLLLMPFDLPVIDQIPLIRFLGDNSWLRVVNRMLIFCIASLGLNILSGLGGQVSLGHAFFMGVGAYTAVLVGGPGSSNLWGWGLTNLDLATCFRSGRCACRNSRSPCCSSSSWTVSRHNNPWFGFIGLHLSRIFLK